MLRDKSGGRPRHHPPGQAFVMGSQGGALHCTTEPQVDILNVLYVEAVSRIPDGSRGAFDKNKSMICFLNV